MKTRFALAALAFLLIGSPGLVQDKKGGMAHSGALAKAMSYIKQKYKGSGLAGHVYCGFAFMMDGASDSELSDCVKWACRGITQKGFNCNWYMGLCMFFLAEYSMKYGLTGEVQSALDAGLKFAAEQQEETGGWCHHKEMWKKNNYNKIGGAKDLGIVTAMTYAAFLEMNSLGVDPGSLTEKAMKNLESVSDGAGFTYGTDNRWGDICMSRGSYVLLGLIATKRTDHPFYQKIVDALPKRLSKVESGHAFGPLHYFSVGAAFHRLGRYSEYAAEYLPKLTAVQEADGSVPMRSDGGKRKDADKFMDSVASTGVFACLLMMQKDGVFVPKAKGKPMAGGDRKPGGPSPFSRKPDKPGGGDQATGPAAKEEMPKPYIPEDFRDSAQPDPEGFGGGVKPEE
jgi:hypothetical protein